MTETSCVISAMDPDDTLCGHVGAPNPACGKQLTRASQSFKICLRSLLVMNARIFFNDCI